MAPVTDLQALLRNMDPVRNPGTYVFLVLPDGASFDPATVVASVREPEGLSVVMERAVALQLGLVPAFECAWITLTVHSDLQAVGLTAAVASALADAGISCNVVAGTHHDHLFVPVQQANDALSVLHALQGARAGAETVTRPSAVNRHGISAADRDFRAAFESCTYPPADFNHRAHVRLAYLYLAEYPVDQALERMRGAILAFIAHHSVDPAKYHETLTRAWILAVRHFMARSGDTSCADDFIDRNPPLLDSRIMLTHYSKEVLFSEEARGAFAEPDLDPIPRH